ncbi:GNAT family N-acetyltransferase [Bdellovibrio sp. HCB2-146]|uniref:GNAT family N-acetyltransferase n=1 Tax=Bdellovibrio sp. HCB2-146 TaxID=3394362 RepID=UPI0039BC7820
MHIEFTQAQEQHLEKLVELVNSAYRGESSKKGWTTEANFLDGQRVDIETLREIIGKEDAAILIAEDEDADKIVGCVQLEKQGSDLYLGMLTVSPELQKKGLGRQLLQESEAFAEFWDCTHIVMTVIGIRTELIEWYEGHGFKKTGEKKPFPYGNERFGIPKVPDLYFEVLKKRLS